MLTDPNSDSGELMGYLKVSAMVLGAGDEAPPDNATGTEDSKHISTCDIQWLLKYSKYKKVDEKLNFCRSLQIMFESYLHYFLIMSNIDKD